eukprot:CAMPEP_0113724724 /NCGR_PEP_ID=MMETSP0038_2-20120614/39274_1 /TAXON_ID=2898 /ORGANISM="Cryptomonas paramecium" /LENGTH=248 /DNA_ID=CAMNT_0000654729 /DNA_START=55 /DNA_END=800 /DNA_ORIENTATION=+ /assembly_acc=CAM_ASM_000170
MALAAREDWKKKTPANHLTFIKGFEAFPCKNDITTNPSVLFDAVKSKDHQRVKELLLSDGDIGIRNTSGSSLLHAAVRTDDIAILDLILSFHPDINHKELPSVGGQSPLHAACLQGNLSMVQRLLRFNADIASRDASASTPLHIAARHGHLEVCTTGCCAEPLAPSGELIGRDGYADLVDGQGKSAYYWAKEFGHTAIAERLPARIYDALAQLDLKKLADPVWAGAKKPKKKAAKGKKGKKGGKKKEG